MSLRCAYQDLNLKEGASIGEIKAAFRRLAKNHHPDAAGRGPEDVEKFIRAQSAYQKLMQKARAHNKKARAESPQKPQSAPGRPASGYRFESSREHGLDIYYRLSVVRPAPGQGRQIILPWQSHQACPRCLGQGQTLAQISPNQLYRPCTCTKCGGSGSVTKASEIKVELTPEMCGQSKVRLRKAGGYNPRQALRGDLILDITWVDRLAESN